MADRGILEDNGSEVSHSTELPAEIKDWDKNHVRDWILRLTDVDDEYAKILYNQKISGSSLLLLEKADLIDLNIELGPAKLIIHRRDELIKLKAQQSVSPGNQSSKSCKPYPFSQYHAAYRYQENSILDVTESGALNLIEPCHEYKAFINFENVTTEEKLKKFTEEVIRFAAACMNSRTNGTIHFGVGDRPEFTHGQILGTKIEDKETFDQKLADVIEGRFEYKHIDVVKKCIKPPRFVEVLEADMTGSGKYVIEVDIEPSSLLCEDNFFHIYSVDTRKSKKRFKTRDLKTDEKDSAKLFYIRDNSSSRNLLAQASSTKSLEEYNKYVDNIVRLSQLRKEAEEKHLTVVKNSVQGSRLCEMITGGSRSLDKSHFERYVLVTNKSHPVQKEYLAFLLDMNLTAVLDFDPESAETGLNNLFDEKRNVNVHLPVQYKITEPVEEIASKLKLTRTTSWVFCNGGIKEEKPSDVNNWLLEKGSSIRDVVSFLCRKDVLPQKKFLIMFLLLSDVTDKHDPMLETFSMFYQELKGTEQILCICGNGSSYTYWKELIEARYGVSISRRCIYELSFAEINGTVLSLWSENRKSSRFLPGGGGKVLLPKKVEDSLDRLSILCVNQCEGGNEDKMEQEERFYKGGKVSWWNFYFSEQPGSMPFIKRDNFDYIIDTIIPDMCSLTQACVRFNILHIPGCGGTTLAMHVLWTLKEKFRCAVLKGKTADYDDVARQVVTLLTCETTDQQTRVPVLLMLDDFDETDAVNDLQQHIEKECLKKNGSSRSPQIVLLNCMRAESQAQTEATDDTVFIGNQLSGKEQKLFEKKLEEIEKIYKNAETFYGFMILKKDFSTEYIQGIVKNTLKGFNFKHKHAQLIAVLVLLDCYCKNANLSVSVCEEFLGLATRPDFESCKAEDGFRKFSTLLTRCTEESSVVYEAVRVIHSSIAKRCLEELTTTFNVSKAQITDFLLTTDLFYDCIQGKEKLMQDVHSTLVKRNYSAESLSAECQFSPLVQAITKETPGFEENVLLNAAKRFEKDAVISQLLSRYHYLRKKAFREAKDWAKKARDLQRDNSYICDTSAQVIKHELKDAISNDKDDPIKPEKMKEYLKMAVSAIEAFRETQEIARKEVVVRYKGKKDFSPYNTAGRLGELQIAVIVTDILERIPVFSLDELRRNILTQVLSGKTKIVDVAKNDPKKQKHASYYHFLQDFAELLHNLKDNMKKQFDFLDNYYVNLGSFYSQKDIRELRTRQEVLRCFRQYAKVFCKSDSKELMKNRMLMSMLKIEKAHQYLEKNKADSYSGLLDCLSNEASAANIEQIVERYIFLFENTRPQDDGHFKDTVNFIYASIVLSRVRPESKLLWAYMKLLNLLCDTLKRPTPLSESLPLHFISVVMLWPETIDIFSGRNLSDKLESYISQMRNSFSNEMKPVCIGKRAVVHFYLGKKTGYERLITQKDIHKCVGSEQSMTTQLQNGKIWKHEKVRNTLRKVTGRICKNAILADTPNEKLKVQVYPMFRSQLSGELGAKVSFFVGFTMNGPVALGIQPES
ncbi:sterile alpha motif domain-containing protein 9-like [Colossoma macropomum]|uniref:sterile alpha motif domain-containing protein 9-like n=1 Tax=Colossoma macropomum TaxID=42526 RepID=UPI00186461A0|nr:sterile alpha motif domain-containing protein 9-like [Colossoma macropomum]